MLPPSPRSSTPAAHGRSASPRPIRHLFSTACAGASRCRSTAACAPRALWWSALCSAPTKSAGQARASKASAPSDWMASTQNNAPRVRHAPPRRVRSMRRPVAYCTEETETRRVCASMASIIAPSGSVPEISTPRHSTLRLASDCQAMRLDGNSWSVDTTLSPACQSRPWATSDSPSEVFLTRAMSSSLPALTSRLRRPRRARSVFSQSGYAAAPRARFCSAKAMTASAVRRGHGATAAWFR